MAVTLGIDPGSAVVAWALVDGPRLLDCGQWRTIGKHPWPARRKHLVNLFAALVKEVTEQHGCRLVAIEATKPNLDPKASAARVRSLMVCTQRTEELCADYGVIAARAGCEVVRVLPTRGLSALGLKCRPKPTDGTQAKAFARLTGRKCLAKDHHEARAYGVALAGQTE